jgi:hypothetical protein
MFNWKLTPNKKNNLGHKKYSLIDFISGLTNLKGPTLRAMV